MLADVTDLIFRASRRLPKKDSNADRSIRLDGTFIEPYERV
jgi:hypothetical protein